MATISSSEIAKFIQDLQTKCVKCQKKQFTKGEIITTYIEKRKQICIIISGEADLLRYDFNGNKNIIEHFTKNDIFGEYFYTITTNNELFVQSKTKTEVLFFLYDDIQKKCRKNCKFHEELENYFPQLILHKIIELNTRIEILTKRTIREKILTYFYILSKRNYSKTFILPFSLTDLADYLSVDRSAMMREISTLKEDGIILKDGLTITYL